MSRSDWSPSLLLRRWKKEVVRLFLIGTKAQNEKRKFRSLAGDDMCCGCNAIETSDETFLQLLRGKGTKYSCHFQLFLTFVKSSVKPFVQVRPSRSVLEVAVDMASLQTKPTNGSAWHHPYQPMIFVDSASLEWEKQTKRSQNSFGQSFQWQLPSEW